MMFALLATVSGTLDEARNVALENTTLLVAIGATLLVGWWIFKKVFKLAMYAGLIGVAAWYWYLNIRV
jgi:hypothetical protein